MKKTVIAVAVVVAVAWTAVSPSRARAQDTAVLVAGSIAAWIVFVSVGAYLTTAQPGHPLLPQEEIDRRKVDSALHFGRRCRSTVEGVALVCW